MRVKDYKLKIDNSQESVNNSEWSFIQCLGSALLLMFFLVEFIYGIQFLDILINVGVKK